MDAACPHCGQLHRHHLVDLGEIDGKRYVHRMPCEVERQVVRRHRIRVARMAKRLRPVVRMFNRLFVRKKG